MILNINPAATANAGADASVCQNSSYLLSGSIGGSAASLTWSSSGTGTFDNINLANATYTPSANDITAGTVTLTITTNDPVGICPAVNDNMILSITPNDNAAFLYTTSTFCKTAPNPTPTITGLSGGTFTFTPAGLSLNNNTGTINLSLSSVGNYTIFYTTNGPCPAKDSMNITITTAPIATFSYSPSSYCQFSSPNPFPLFTSGASAGVFTATPSGLNFANSISGEIDLTTSAPGTYMVYNTISAAGGCATDKDSALITINAAPIVTANTSSSSVCIGNSITLTGGGAVTYNWTGGIADGVSFVPTSTNSYTVTGTDGNGCINSASVNVIVNSLPTVTANTSATVVCAGNNVTLTGGGATTYSWTEGVTDGISFVPASTTTYTVTGLDNNGCSNTASLSVTVNTLPVVIASASSSAVCVGGSVTLTGGGATTYSWTGGVTNGISFVPSSTTTYTVTGTDGNGCNNTASVNVIVNSLPTVSANSSSSAVCTGNSVTLTGSGATTYTWTGGINDGISFVPNGTDTYTVTGTDNLGCVNTASVGVTVNALPTVTASSSSSAVCSGNSVTLTGGGATTYSWTGGINDGVSFVPSGSDTYTVTGTDNNGCNNTASVSVTVNSLPTVTANATSSAVCAGNSVILTGGGATTYSWTGGVNDGVSFVPSGTDSYTVTGTDNNGCNNTASVSVTVNTLPTVTASSSSSAVCAGNSVTLNGGGATTYTWTGGVNDGVSFVPSGTDTYTVTGTDINGCNNTASVSVTVNVLPTVTASSSSSAVCTGNSVTLNGGGATSYSWTGGVNDGVSFVPNGTDTYTVTGTDGNGCSNTASVNVTVNALPTVAANTSSSAICAGNSVTLTGSGATTYSWTGGVNDGVSFVPSGTATYTVTGTDGNGCSNTASVSVIVNALPTVTANASSAAVCTGNSVTLTGGGATTYSWTGGVNDGVSFVPSGTDTYTVTGTDGNGCSNTASVSITVNTLPVAPSASNSSPICDGGTVNLTTSTTGIINWSGPQGYSSTSQNPTLSPATLAMAGTYSVTVTSSTTGCVSLAGTTTVVINAIPSSPIASSTPVCAGSSIDLTTSTVAGATYAWTGPLGFTSTSQDPIITGSTLAMAGTYYLTVTQNGCTSAPGSVQVVVNNCSGPDLTITKTVDNTHPMVGGTVVFTIVVSNNGPGDASGVVVTDILPSGYTYVGQNATIGAYNSLTGLWTIGNLIDGGTETLTITVTVNASGNYLNTATIEGGSTDPNTLNNTSSAGTSPEVLNIPEGFSPNGDGTNDLFVIRGIENYPNNTFIIFNRWGDKVYEAQPYNNTWDGTATEGLRVGGNQLPIGTYFYVLDLGDGSTPYKGTIYLNR